MRSSRKATRSSALSPAPSGTIPSASSAICFRPASGESGLCTAAFRSGAASAARNIPSDAAANARTMLSTASERFVSARPASVSPSSSRRSGIDSGRPRTPSAASPTRARSSRMVQRRRRRAHAAVARRRASRASASAESATSAFGSSSAASSVAATSASADRGAARRVFREERILVVLPPELQRSSLRRCCAGEPPPPPRTPPPPASRRSPRAAGRGSRGPRSGSAEPACPGRQVARRRRVTAAADSRHTGHSPGVGAFVRHPTVVRHRAAVRELHVVLDHEERRVRRHELVREAEREHLVLDLGVAAADAQVVEQPLDARLGPDLRDEVAARRRLRKLDRNINRDRLAARIPAQVEHRLARAAEAAAHQQRASLEEVGQPARLAVERATASPALRRRPRVDQERRPQPLEQRAERDLEVLVFTDVARVAAPLDRELGQQEVLHVVADAEGEEAGARGLLPPRGEDAFRRRLADGRIAVGEEDDRGEAAGAVSPARPCRRLQSVGDVGPAGRRDVVRGAARPLQVLRRRVEPAPLAERGHVGRERDDVEAVARLQRVEAGEQRGARLLDLPALHRAGAVDHERDVARDRGRRRELRDDAGDEPPVRRVARPVGQQRDVEAVAARDRAHHERPGGRRAVGGEARLRLLGADLQQRLRVRRAVGPEAVRGGAARAGRRSRAVGSRISSVCASRARRASTRA